MKNELRNVWIFLNSITLLFYFLLSTSSSTKYDPILLELEEIQGIFDNWNDAFLYNSFDAHYKTNYGKNKRPLDSKYLVLETNDELINVKLEFLQGNTAPNVRLHNDFIKKTRASYEKAYDFDGDFKSMAPIITTNYQHGYEYVSISEPQTIRRFKIIWNELEHMSNYNAIVEESNIANHAIVMTYNNNTCEGSNSTYKLVPFHDNVDGENSIDSKLFLMKPGLDSKKIKKLYSSSDLKLSNQIFYKSIDIRIMLGGRVFRNGSCVAQILVPVFLSSFNYDPRHDLLNRDVNFKNHLFLPNFKKMFPNIDEYLNSSNKLSPQAAMTIVKAQQKISGSGRLEISSVSFAVNLVSLAYSLVWLLCLVYSIFLAGYLSKNKQIIYWPVVGSKNGFFIIAISTYIVFPLTISLISLNISLGETKAISILLIVSSCLTAIFLLYRLRKYSKLVIEEINRVTN